jgi:hypothetical protein
MDYTEFKPADSSEFKDISNGWIDPDGNLYPCGYMDHNNWAGDYIQHDWGLEDDFTMYWDRLGKETGNHYAYEYLTKKGWMRLLTWTQLKSRLVGHTDKSKPNAAQKDTMYLWCSYNNYKYKDLFLD